MALVNRSPVLQQVEMVAPTDATVLLLGETASRITAVTRPPRHDDLFVGSFAIAYSVQPIDRVQFTQDAIKGVGVVLADSREPAKDSPSH